MTTRHPPSGTAGQASVEVIGLLPLTILIALIVFAFLTARTADEQAGEAAEAAGVALLGGTDPQAAAKAALPSGVRRHARITITGSRVRVRVRPLVPLSVPGLADRLAGDAEVDAGPTRP